MQAHGRNCGGQQGRVNSDLLRERGSLYAIAKGWGAISLRTRLQDRKREKQLEVHEQRLHQLEVDVAKMP